MRSKSSDYGLNQEPADKVAAEINEAGGKAIGVAANVLIKKLLKKQEKSL